MIYLKISDSKEYSDAAAHKKMMRMAVRKTLRRFWSPRKYDLTIVIAGNDQLQELNRQFLERDTPTDVLAFPVNQTDPQTGRWYLGDILIAYPRARTQAAAGGHPIQDELSLLVVHGVLHLIGFDHTNQEEKTIMWAKQAEILSELGYRTTD